MNWRVRAKMQHVMTDSVTDGWRVTAVRERLREATGNADPELTRLNRLVARLLDVPVSLASLVDDTTQVFLGEHGLPDAWHRAGQTPLSHSVCQHVVRSDAPVVIDDMRRHPLGLGDLARRDIDVMAYAGVPLRAPDGTTLGSFCAIDTKPHHWTDADVELLHDLAALAADRLELQRLRASEAGLDRLTGLLTPEAFERLVERSLATAPLTAVLALGLDGFRLVNEALGHAMGDRLLAGVAQRLSAEVGPGDAVGRLAGDQFLVLLHEPASEAAALATADRLRAALAAEPYDLLGHPQRTTVSAGVATATEPMAAGDLVDLASTRMRHAKHGEDRPAGLAARAGSRLRLRSAIAGADERGELHLAYQPVVDLRTGAPVALEGLMRWTHPQLGSIVPDEFIPAAELSGAIVPLGEWAIRQACEDVAAVRRLPGLGDLAVAVNVAPVQLALPTFPGQVAEALERAGLPPQALVVEITERTLLADDRTPRETLDAVRALGVRIAIDDFGTGYSALSYLTQVPADVLKVDRRFVESMHADPRARSLVSGILGLAEGLHMRAVAEGVETEAQRLALLEIGFERAQGHHFSRPLPLPELIRALVP